MGHKPKILVVDDNQLQRTMVVKRLKKQEYHVQEAGSGDYALAFLRKNNVDLILLDLNMPGKDGHEVLKVIREKHSSIDLPVIMVTAEEDTQTIIKSFELGANDYILKQISFRIALQRINTQLKIKALSEESNLAHKVDAINAMIVTYNHEINNPLAIIFGNLGNDYSKLNEEKYKNTLTALERIRDLVHKIQELDASKVEYSNYTARSKMVKID